MRGPVLKDPAMIRIAALVAALMLPAACDAAGPPTTPVETPAPAAPDPSPSTRCLDEIGQAAAQALAERCRRVSPATHPPCNVANPCAMIQAEVDRACALWDEQEERPAECGA